MDTKQKVLVGAAVASTAAAGAAFAFKSAGTDSKLTKALVRRQHQWHRFEVVI